MTASDDSTAITRKPPSQAEFAALAATCQDKGAAIDACLLNLGLKRAK